MRIVHVITRLILGGAQENTLLSCRESARRGHDVTLLAGPPEGPEGSLLEEARRLPIRTVLVPALVRAVRPYSDAVAWGDLVKHFRDIRPDVVHTHSSKAGVLGRHAARRAGVPCVVHTIHGLAFDRYGPAPANRLYRAAERRAARWSHRLVAVSRRMADRAAEAGLAPRDRIDVIYSGIETERFRAAADRREAVRRRWGADGETFVFLKLARLFHLKGHRFVLPAFARVAQRRPNVRLVLVGEGVLRGQLETLARQLGVADRVRFEGLVVREEVPGVLWAADAVVHAGLREGLARVLVQGGLCERPIITYDIGGAREVVQEGVNGVVLPPPRPGADPLEGAAPLAEAMDRLAADPDEARRMGRQWPQDVLGEFDHRRMVDRLLDLYEGILRGEPGGREQRTPG